MSLDQDLSYWKSELASATKSVEHPADHAGPVTKSQSAVTHSITLPPELGARVRELADKERAEPYGVLLAVFVVLLGRYSRQDDLVIGAVKETAPSIGKELFEDVSVVHCQLTGEPTFREFLQRIGTSLAESKAHAVAFDTRRMR